MLLQTEFSSKLTRHQAHQTSSILVIDDWPGFQVLDCKCVYLSDIADLALQSGKGLTDANQLLGAFQTSSTLR